LAARESDFSTCFLVPSALRGSTLYMRPHVSGTERIGFSKQDAVLGRQANLRESSKSKELAKLRLQVFVVVKANDACESKKEIMRLRE
jgi:hypothetical protein